MEWHSIIIKIGYEDIKRRRELWQKKIRKLSKSEIETLTKILAECMTGSQMNEIFQECGVVLAMRRFCPKRKGEAKMSRCITEKITCPKCGKDSDFMTWSSINTMLNPEMKAKVRNREVFRFHCPFCGEEANVDYGFLYHQMEDKMMIYYVHDQEEAKQVHEMFRGENAVHESFETSIEGYLYRIVLSKNELLEKLMIFDAEMDDRAIEIIKVLYIGNVIEQNPDLHIEEVRVAVEDPGKITLYFFEEGHIKAHCDVERDFYESIMTDIVSKRPPIREDDIQIDVHWAVKALEQNR